MSYNTRGPSKSRAYSSLSWLSYSSSWASRSNFLLKTGQGHWGLVALYMFCQFFFNLGTNAITFIVSSHRSSEILAKRHTDEKYVDTGRGIPRMSTVAQLMDYPLRAESLVQ